MASNNTKAERKQVNYRLPPVLIEYIEKWHMATGIDREDVVAKMIQAYKDSVGDPPKPLDLPSIPKHKKP